MKIHYWKFIGGHWVVTCRPVGGGDNFRVLRTIRSDAPGRRRAPGPGFRCPGRTVVGEVREVRGVGGCLLFVRGGTLAAVGTGYGGLGVGVRSALHALFRGCCCHGFLLLLWGVMQLLTQIRSRHAQILSTEYRKHGFLSMMRSFGNKKAPNAQVVYSIKNEYPGRLYITGGPGRGGACLHCLCVQAYSVEKGARHLLCVPAVR